MPTSFDKLAPSADANRRFARLAISWFAVDPVQVEQTLRAVQERQDQGETIDFLDALVGAGILTQKQTDRLRLDHSAGSGDANGTTENPTKLDPPGGADDPAQMGPYRILRRLGKGGMGAVYLAFDGNANRQVAVKVLSAEQAPKKNILNRFQREGRHGALLAHPNIVRSFDMDQDQSTGLHYIVLEYVDGPSAHDLLERGGKMQIGDALHVILDIARALEHAHKNQIIHRDIKPGNILLTSSGLAKLSDLGLAKRRDDTANLTNATQGIGTPYYMPYEQAMNAKMADERSDIYALGATLYHLLTGDVPFPGASSLEVVEKKGIGEYLPAGSHNPEVSDPLEDILARMLARDPDDRYQTVSEVIVDLERTGLAAPIPSFVHIDSALQDPVVVERLTSPIEATQPDMNVKQALEEKQAKANQLWFLRYRDQKGALCKAKATIADILARLRKGAIPPSAEASRSPQGPFKPLSEWPEFQKTLAALATRKKPPQRKVKPTPDDAPASPKRSWPWWWFAAAAGIGAVIIVGVIAIVLAKVL